MEGIKTRPNIGNRFVAGLVDYILIFGFMILFSIYFGEPNDEGGYSVHGLKGFVIPFFWFIMTVGVEQLFGATLGNLLVGIKPTSLIGSIENSSTVTYKKLVFSQSLKRHLLDMIDISTFGITAVVALKNTKMNQRIGDIWANTTVVEVKGHLPEAKSQ